MSANFLTDTNKYYKIAYLNVLQEVMPCTKTPV